MIDLPSRELQALVGEKTLEQLETIIYLIPGSGINDPSDIYKPHYLEKIFLAFSGQDALLDVEFRKLILNRLSDQRIRQLANSLNIDNQLPFQEIIQSILRLQWGDNENTRIFLKFFDLPDNFLPSARQSYPNIEPIAKPGCPFKTLKDFQVHIYQQTMEHLQNPLQKILIQMPTGSGKTRTTMEIISTYMNQHPKKSTIWVANSEELCEQAIECFKEVWEHIGNFEVDVIRVIGRNNLIIPERSSFIVGGFQKLNSLFSRNQRLADELSPCLGLIIIDEAHQIIAPTYMKVIERLCKNNFDYHLIGLTATPGRGDVYNQETLQLIEFFSGNRITIESGDYSVFQYLRKKEILAYIKKDPLITGCKYELTEKEREWIKKHYDFSKSFLNNISSDNLRNVKIIKKLKEICKEDKKIIFFAGSVEQSKFICATLNFLNIRAEHIDGTTKKDRRRNIIQDFKEGPLNVICNYGVLTTGFDAPKTDVVFIARPTMSIVLYNQMVGRGLRGPAIGGKEICTIIDVKDDIEPFHSTDIESHCFDDYWEKYE